MLSCSSLFSQFGIGLAKSHLAPLVRITPVFVSGFGVFVRSLVGELSPPPGTAVQEGVGECVQSNRVSISELVKEYGSNDPFPLPEERVALL